MSVRVVGRGVIFSWGGGCCWACSSREVDKVGGGFRFVCLFVCLQGEKLVCIET